jgi:hypothetical protein
LTLFSYGFKTGILLGLCAYATGALLFFPAAELMSFSMFLLGLFIIAFGLAFLETAANPCASVMGVLDFFSVPSPLTIVSRVAPERRCGENQSLAELQRSRQRDRTISGRPLDILRYVPSLILLPDVCFTVPLGTDYTAEQLLSIPAEDAAAWRLDEARSVQLPYLLLAGILQVFSCPG